MDVLTATVAEIGDWLIECLAASFEMSPDEVDPTENLAHSGMDSMMFLILGAKVEEVFEVEIEPDFFRDCLTIDDVAKALYDRVHAPAEEADEHTA